MKFVPVCAAASDVQSGHCMISPRKSMILDQLLEEQREQHPANPQLHTRPTTCKPKRQVPQAATIRINLELLMMSIMVPETC